MSARKRPPALVPPVVPDDPPDDEQGNARYAQLGQTLARQYLEHTGLTASAALDALLWSHPAPIVSDATLSPDDLAHYEAADKVLRTYSDYAFALVVGIKAVPPAGIPAGTIESMRTRAAEVDGARLDTDPIYYVARSPDTDPLRLVRDELIERAMLRQAELRDGKLEALLLTPKGRMPDPYTWVDAVGGDARLIDEPHIPLLVALERLARMEAEETADTERTAREAMAMQLAVQERGGLQHLGDRIIFPRALTDGGYQKGAGTAGKLAKVKQGELFATTDAQRLMEEAAEVVVERTQLGDLSPAQVRALAGVFRLFSSFSDEGGVFRQDAIRVSARLMYKAAEVDPHNGRACRDIFAAVEALSSRQIYAALKFKDAAGKWMVVGERCSVFAARPIWTSHDSGRHRRTEAEADLIAKAWAGGGGAIDGKKIPLPDQYDITLPPLMKRVWHSLVIAGDVLKRLEAGAKQTRGDKESFSGLDWRLFMEITQRVQPQQVSGGTLLSYVDRDALLADYYGVKEVAKARARGKYRSHYVAQYEKSVAALASGELAVRVEQGHAARRGRALDVFEPNPDVVHGLRDRAAQATKRIGRPDTATLDLPLPAPTKERKRRPRRPTP